MKPQLRIVVMLCLGLIPQVQLFSAQKNVPQSSGRQWASEWLLKTRAKYNPVLPVNLTITLPERGQYLPVPTSRFEKPLITGPFALLVNLAAAAPGLPTPNNFSYWLKYEADDDMRKRYDKIIGDLKNYFIGRGHTEINAKQLAERLFHAKSEIYYPLVHHQSPNLDGLKPNQTRNPYSLSTISNTASDNYNLGLMCQKVRNYEQAAQLYLQAAKTGHARAQASLAYLYEIGEGVPQSPSQAVSYYTRAARQGHAIAQYNLGRIYQNGLSGGEKPIAPNSKQAEFYLQRAAAQGVVSAYHQLGILYYNFGLQINAKSLTEKEFQEWDTNGDKVISAQENRYLRDAHDHFLLAARRSYGPALHALGIMYLQGQGVPVDPSKAKFWLQQAASYPQPDSHYNLAQLYESGRGTKQNLARAFMHYQIAARMGHAPSQYNIGLFYYQDRKAGTLISIDVPEEFAQKHPESGIIEEMISLNPQKNSVLSDASALYRKSNPDPSFRTLDIYVGDTHANFALQVLRKLMVKQSVFNKPKISTLGEDDPVQASAWWALAAEQKQPAAQQALALVNSVLTPEQIHFARAIAQAEKKLMDLPSPQIPVGKEQKIETSRVVDWGTGFFVSRDGYVVTGKHLARSGNRFQITTENGSFPARAVPASSDLNQYLLLKIEGDYDFPVLSISSSHSTRLRDPVKVLGYQMAESNSGPQPIPARATTLIRGILGAQADPRFFTLNTPVLGDQFIFQFEKYLDDDKTKNNATIAIKNNELKLSKLRSVTRERLLQAFRTAHPLLSAVDVKIGYELATDLWYDKINHKWLTKPDNQNRAKKYTVGSWIALDNNSIQRSPHVYKIKKDLWYDSINRKWLTEPDNQNRAQKYTAESWVTLDSESIQQLPPEEYISEYHQALLRVAVLPAIVSDGKKFKRLYQIIEDKLTRPAIGKIPSPKLERFIIDAKFKGIDRSNGFRGAALVNSQGQAIGLYFPSSQNRSPDVFQNFSSYHRYILKSDHLLSYLNRVPEVNYQTKKYETPQNEPSDSSSQNLKAYLLAKAQASMVLVEVMVAPEGGAQ